MFDIKIKRVLASLLGSMVLVQGSMGLAKTPSKDFGSGCGVVAGVLSTLGVAFLGAVVAYRQFAFSDSILNRFLSVRNMLNEFKEAQLLIIDYGNFKKEGDERRKELKKYILKLSKVLKNKLVSWSKVFCPGNSKDAVLLARNAIGLLQLTKTFAPDVFDDLDYDVEKARVFLTRIFFLDEEILKASNKDEVALKGVKNPIVNENFNFLNVNLFESSPESNNKSLPFHNEGGPSASQAEADETSTVTKTTKEKEKEKNKNQIPGQIGIIKSPYDNFKSDLSILPEPFNVPPSKPMTLSEEFPLVYPTIISDANYYDPNYQHDFESDSLTKKEKEKEESEEYRRIAMEKKQNMLENAEDV